MDLSVGYFKDVQYILRIVCHFFSYYKTTATAKYLFIIFDP